MASPVELNGGAPAAVALPLEAFPCPHCGQMLGPEVRVCAACHRAIDPAQIRVAVDHPPEVARTFTEKAPVARRTPFPWAVCLGGFLGLILLMGLAEARFGPAAITHYVEASVRYVELVPFATALWVLFDASRKRVPRPVQWGLATMLLWPIAFPWYLARRRRPDTVCPFVESGAGSVVRIVLIWLLINIAAVIFFGSALNSLPK